MRFLAGEAILTDTGVRQLIDFSQPVAVLLQVRTEAIAMSVACREHQGHTGYMGRIIGTILGAILAIWLVVTAASGIFATLKTFLVIGLIAMAVFTVVWLVARRPRRD